MVFGAEMMRGAQYRTSKLVVLLQRQMSKDASLMLFVPLFRWIEPRLDFQWGIEGALIASGDVAPTNEVFSTPLRF